MRVNNAINDPVMDRMFIGTILTLAINVQGRMLIGQFLNLMTLPDESATLWLKIINVLRTYYTNVHFNLDQSPIKMLQWYMPGE
jgi:hypothetical protein